MNDIFWRAGKEEQMAGYIYNQEVYHCLFCECVLEEGIIYKHDDRLVSAEKAMKLHIQEVHGGVLGYLTSLDKKISGLTPLQSRVIRMLAEGCEETTIQEDLGIAQSTLKNQQHALEDKERQAQAMAAVFALLEKVSKVSPKSVDTTLDKAAIIEHYLPEGVNGPLIRFDGPEATRRFILEQLLQRLKAKKSYTEKELLELVNQVYPQDPDLLLRCMLQLELLKVDKNDKYSRVLPDEKVAEPVAVTSEPKSVKSKLTQMQLHEPISAGVFQIRNMFNGKLYIGTAMNIDDLSDYKRKLNVIAFANKGLQEDWVALGEGSFAFEVLERIELDEEEAVTQEKLKAIKKKWQEQLKPYNDKGYHRRYR